MNEPADALCLKVDVDTHDGMRFGVPRLLDTFRNFGVPATFFLSFGPDNSGKAIWKVIREPGFLVKMLRTRALRLYGMRTILSGTLLPARLIATEFPEIVQRIEAEGHEVGVHAWDHRLWQDHLHRLSREEIAEQFYRSFAAFDRILGRRPTSVAAPSWRVSRVSLEIEDTLGLTYSSHMRGGPPCFVEFDGYRSRTLQVPTTQPTLDEILTRGQRDPRKYVDALLKRPSGLRTLVLTVHAEVEGGPYLRVLSTLLATAHGAGLQVITLENFAQTVLSNPEPPGVLVGHLSEIPGRAARVLMPAQTSARVHFKEKP